MCRLGKFHAESGESAQNLSVAIHGPPLKDVGGVPHSVVTGWFASPLGIDTSAKGPLLPCRDDTYNDHTHIS
jgi:hypothetical protein